MNGSTANPAYVAAGDSARDARRADRLRRIDRVGDGFLYGLCALAALVGALVLLLVAYQMIHGAHLAISKFGIGFLFPLLVGWWALRHRRTPEVAAPEHSARAMLVESAHNAQVLLAYFALSSVDIVLARQVLDEHDAGLYAAGLIMAKVMLFLPQFVVVIAFPDMATPESRQRALVRSLSVVAALGVVVVVAAEVLSGVAMVFVGGSDFGEVERLLWVFAVLGTVLAMLQLQVYAVLARQGRLTVLLVWAALAAVALLGSRVHTLEGLVSVVVAVDAALLVVLTVVSLRIARRVEPTPAPGPVA